MPISKTDKLDETATETTPKPKRAAAGTKAKPAAKKTAAKKPATKTVKKKATSKSASNAAPRAVRKVDTSGDGAKGKILVVVESPAKAKTLQKYLGPNYYILASVGHIIDLPSNRMAVDIPNGFSPEYVIMESKYKVIEKIRNSAMQATKVYLAPDPDREGEAIAWHLAGVIKDPSKFADKVTLENFTPGFNMEPRDVEIHRATFNEITKRAVHAAIENPTDINQKRFESQQVRRILDRLVGYSLSPLLWKTVAFGLSGGRVQSVAVRVIVDREREIKAFNAEEYWSLEAQVEAGTPPPFTMRLAQVDGKKAEIANEDQVRALLASLNAQDVQSFDSLDDDSAPARRNEVNRRKLVSKSGAKWTISSIEKKDVRRRPAPPFITSTLQQEASRRYGFGAKRTMALAQGLYQGLALGSMGHTALITYMRTDSTRISPEAINEVRAHIGRTYGERSLPEKPNFFSSKKNAQDAHECVRPTDMGLTPDSVSPYLDADQLKLYTIIWNRFIACQMADAIFEQTRIESKPTPALLFAATGLVQKFAGYLAVYEEGRDEQPDDENSARLPQVAKGDSLNLNELKGLQHFTQPPPRYTEATLVKELEKQGIGRPSTYATIVTVIQKDYAVKDDSRRFRPTEMGELVTDLLVNGFPDLLNTSFTAEMEERLDAVEEGSQEGQALLQEFWDNFNKQLALAAEAMKSVKQQATPTDIVCDKCGEANMVIKFGRNGRFLACPNYPKCKNTKNFTTSDDDEITAVEQEVSEEVCPACGKNMIVKSGRNGRFLACPGYPDCKSVLSVKTGVKCPECKVGDLVERVSKRGKMFFSCNAYPACNHVEWDRPIPKECPQCHSPYMLQKEGKKPALVCPNTDCKYKEFLPIPDSE